MIEKVRQLLKEIKYGTMSSLAYDTAWVARLGDIDRDLSNSALEWLCSHQLPDGSWGAEQPFYYHDRVISTLAAMIALSREGRRSMDKKMIERGLIALERITSGATQGLQADPNGATVGFEMIVPTLVREAEELGIIKQQGDRILGRLAKMRAEKMAKLQGRRINKYMTAAFSAEMAGEDGIEKLDIENLQEDNGSIGHSPSASAYYSIFIKRANPDAIHYISTSKSRDGGICDLYPFDIYERAWILWNLSWITNWEQSTLDLFKPHLDYLYKVWKPGKGVGFSVEYCIPDGDDTLITFDVLSRHHRKVDIESVLTFEKDDHFSCYELEVGISPSVNIHALMTLFQEGYDLDHPTVQKVLRFLTKSEHLRHYWIDKWHSSPFYTSAHFIMACANHYPHLAQANVDWITSTQNRDGSWGYALPTAEETAYCLQALSIWKQSTGNSHSVNSAIKKAQVWLQDHVDGPYPPLWIGKGLYSAELVVKSAILSALFLCQ